MQDYYYHEKSLTRGEISDEIVNSSELQSHATRVRIAFSNHFQTRQISILVCFRHLHQTLRWGCYTKSLVRPGAVQVARSDRLMGRHGLAARSTQQKYVQQCQFQLLCNQRGCRRGLRPLRAPSVDRHTTTRLWRHYQTLF